MLGRIFSLYVYIKHIFSVIKKSWKFIYEVILNKSFKTASSPLELKYKAWQQQQKTWII